MLWHHDIDHCTCICLRLQGTFCFFLAAFAAWKTFNTFIKFVSNGSNRSFYPVRSFRFFQSYHRSVYLLLLFLLVFLDQFSELFILHQLRDVTFFTSGRCYLGLANACSKQFDNLFFGSICCVCHSSFTSFLLSVLLPALLAAFDLLLILFSSVSIFLCCSSVVNPILAHRELTKTLSPL